MSTRILKVFRVVQFLGGCNFDTLNEKPTYKKLLFLHAWLVDEIEFNGLHYLLTSAPFTVERWLEAKESFKLISAKHFKDIPFFSDSFDIARMLEAAASSAGDDEFKRKSPDGALSEAYMRGIADELIDEQYQFAVLHGMTDS